MSSINNPTKDETYKREGNNPSIPSRFHEAEPFPGQYHPTTTGERVATHIPGTDAHAERTELPGRTSPGPRATANVLGTADYERKREFQGETNPADSTGRGGVGNKQFATNYDTQAGTHGTSAAEPVYASGHHTGNAPSTGAVEGTAPFHNEHGTRTETSRQRRR
jgi:hypothetical protein